VPLRGALAWLHQTSVPLSPRPFGLVPAYSNSPKGKPTRKERASEGSVLPSPARSDHRHGPPPGPGRSCRPGVGVPVREGTEGVVLADFVGELSGPVDRVDTGRGRATLVIISRWAASSVAGTIGRCRSPMADPEEWLRCVTGLAYDDRVTAVELPSGQSGTMVGVAHLRRMARVITRARSCHCRAYLAVSGGAGLKSTDRRGARTP